MKVLWISLILFNTRKICRGKGWKNFFSETTIKPTHTATKMLGHSLGNTCIPNIVYNCTDFQKFQFCIFHECSWFSFLNTVLFLGGGGQMTSSRKLSNECNPHSEHYWGNIMSKNFIHMYGVSQFKVWNVCSYIMPWILWKIKRWGRLALKNIWKWICFENWPVTETADCRAKWMRVCCIQSCCI